VNHPLASRLLSEFAGTGILVGLGTGAVVASVGMGAERFPLLAVAWFVAVTIPVVLFAGISGAHLNPVVSLALAADRRLPAREVPPHLVAQVAGAFAGSAVVEIVLGPGGHLGATIPASNDVLRIFGDEFAFTFVLASTYVIGPFTGSSLNPARSLAPAVLSGTYTDLWVYFLAAPLAALAAVAVVRAVTRDRFPKNGRPTPNPERIPPLAPAEEKGRPRETRTAVYSTDKVRGHDRTGPDLLRAQVDRPRFPRLRDVLPGRPPIGRGSEEPGSCKLALLDHAFWTRVAERGAPSPTTGKRDGVVLASKVDDIDRGFEELRAKGIPGDSSRVDRPMMGLRNGQMYDPDRNLVELDSDLKKK
jgi:aquaporin NIP